MTKETTKIKKEKAELYPLSKKEFETLYDKAWDYGWVYGKFFQELYDEYLVNWVYFVDYLDVLKGLNNNSRKYKREKINGTDYAIVKFKKDKNEKVEKPVLIEAKDFYFNRLENEKVEKPEPIIKVEILIGEAPPYWKGNAENKDKSYFYNPNYFVKKGSWITAPLAFKKIAQLKSNSADKTSKLSKLAEKGMFLFDIFPFPIIQDTKIRQAVSGKFPEHIQTYFIPKLNSIIEYIDINKDKIKYGFAATTYGSLHLLFGDQTRKLFIRFYKNFYKNGIISSKVDKNQFVFEVKASPNQIIAFKKNKPTALFNYIYKLICPAKDYDDNYFSNLYANNFNANKYVIEINTILNENKIPILMDGSGNVNFKKLFNFNILTKPFQNNQQVD